MRKIQLAQYFDGISSARANRGRRPLADAVHGQDSRFFKRRRVKRARGVGKMVFGKKQFGFARPQSGNSVMEHFPHEQLFLNPDGNGLRETFKSPRREGVVGFQKPLELEIGLVVKGHAVQIADRQSAFFQTVPGREVRKFAGVFFARKPLFVRRGDNFAVHKERGCAVVVISGYAQNGARHTKLLKQRIDKRRDGRTACQHDQSAEQHKHQNQRQQPEFFRTFRNPHKSCKKSMHLSSFSVWVLNVFGCELMVPRPENGGSVFFPHL